MRVLAVWTCVSIYKLSIAHIFSVKTSESLFCAEFLIKRSQILLSGGGFSPPVCIVPTPSYHKSVAYSWKSPLASIDEPAQRIIKG
jgi:hypothetical protein